MQRDRLRLFLLACALLGTLAGCVTVAKNVRYVSFAANPKKGKDLGFDKVEHCGIRVFGFGPFPKYDSMFAIARKKGVRSVQSMSIEHDQFSIFVWTKDCFLARGSFYK